MQDSQWLRDNSCGVRMCRQPHYWIVFWCKIVPKVPLTECFGVDAKYAKHLKVFGEMCVVADTNNKAGRTKIRLIQEERSVYLLGTVPNMQEMSTDS